MTDLSFVEERDIVNEPVFSVVDVSLEKDKLRDIVRLPDVDAERLSETSSEMDDVTEVLLLADWEVDELSEYESEGDPLAVSVGEADTSFDSVADTLFERDGSDESEFDSDDDMDDVKLRDTSFVDDCVTESVGVEEALSVTDSDCSCEMLDEAVELLDEVLVIDSVSDRDADGYSPDILKESE